MEPPASQRRRRPGCLLPALLIVGLAAAVAVCAPEAVGSLRAPSATARLALMAPPDSLPVPVAGVAPGRLADTWGAARSGGRSHEGIDIFADRGTAVLSATEGVVSRVGTNSLGGNVVWVTGPGREAHYYAHLEDYAPGIAAGDLVVPGDTLGFVGTSGNAAGTPPHLHYGIYRASGAVNPYPRLVAE